MQAGIAIARDWHAETGVFPQESGNSDLLASTRAIPGPVGFSEHGGVINMISEPTAPILATVDEKKIKVAADTGACAHCLGPGDLPDGMMVEQCPQRNFCGPDGKPIEHFGEAKMRLMQPNGNHVSVTSQVLGVTRALHSVPAICDKNQDMLFTKDLGIVVLAGVFKEVLEKCRHIAEYPRGGGLWVSEMTVQMPQPPGDQTPAPFAGPGVSR